MHPKAQEVFESLVPARATADERQSLAGAVDEHTAELARAARDNELLPMDLAAALASRLKMLLADETLSDAAAALVVGAARYYCSENDHLPDRGSVTGLDDDLAVFNHVAQRIGRPDLRLED